MKLNGNLIFNGGGVSQLENVIIERVPELPTVDAAEAGRIVFLTSDNVYYYNTSTAWSALATGGNAGTLVLADVSDVTTTATEVNELHGSRAVLADFAKLNAISATAANINILDGTLVTSTELGYVSGVTSAIQTQLDGKQPLDATLTGIAALGSISAADSLLFTSDGATFTYANDQEARSLLGIGDIATYASTDYVNVDGTNPMTAALIMGGFTVSNMGTPTTATDATTKAYVDSLVAAGTIWRNPIVSPDLMGFLAAAPVSPTASYTYVVTTAGTWGALTVDVNDVVEYVGGVWVKIKTLAIGDRFIIAGEHGAAGTVDTSITSLTVSGSLLDKSDLVQYLGGDVTLAASWSEPEGVATAGGTPAMVQGITVLDSAPTSSDYGRTYLFNTSTNSWYEIAGPGSIGDGVGLSYTGNVLNVNLGAGVFALPTDEVGIDLYDTSSGAIILTTDGSTRSTSTASKLHLLLDLGAAGQLVQSASGIKIAANTISPTELATSVAGDGLVGGGGTALSVASAAGTAGTVGTLVITADTVGVALGTTSISAAAGDHVHAASAITYVNTTSGLVATDVQAAIDEVEAKVVVIQAFDTSIQSEVDAVEAAVGLTTAGVLVPFTGANYVAAAATIADAVTALDTQAKTEETARIAVDTRVTNSYYLYDAVTTPNSTTTHVVTHTCGVKYCNVTVVDNTDNVIIPQSIVYDAVGQLTVTFTTAITCRIIVIGIA